MGFLKFLQRKSDAPAAKPVTDSPDAVTLLRLRARRRLIGAAILVVVGVIGFPLVFETRPRPIPVDLPIEIPRKDGAAPLTIPPAPTRTADAAQVVPSLPVHGSAENNGQTVAATTVTAIASAARGTEIVEDRNGNPLPAVPVGVSPVQTGGVAAQQPTERVAEKAADKASAKAVDKQSAHKAEPRLDPKADQKNAHDRQHAEKSADKANDKLTDNKWAEKQAAAERATKAREAEQREAARVQALLEGRSPAMASAETASTRVIVQVGAYADPKSAQEARAKVERLGLKTYTQVVDTPEGKRTRVRVGPFSSRDEANKAADKLRNNGLAGHVLTL